MKAQLTTYLLAFFLPIFTFAQYEFYQYFDGADTNDVAVINIDLDTSSFNIWQIGPPQKIIFDSAATAPNVIVTDTINYYPSNNFSSFQYTIKPWETWGILAIQWKQKIDMDFGKDGGMIEFSVDGGSTWQSAFNNPYIYNFYGYNETNVDTIATGEEVFTGVDSTWKDIWLCYDMTWLNWNDSIMVKHTLVSDSIDNDNEGWMMDNLLVHITIIHTVNEVEQDEYLIVAPNPTSGRVEISAKKINEYHIIEKMELHDSNGQLLEEWEMIPTKFFIDIGNYPNGLYYLSIQTNKERQVAKIMLQK
ncbi:MAG: T9SS type A sorting domain-containing protein [Saprospiraceae bacterium]